MVLAPRTTDISHRHTGATRGVTGREGRLEGHELSRPEARDGPARTISRNGGRVGRVDHVDRVVAVGDSQGDSTSGVGANVLGHDTGRALGGQHHVNAQTAAPLGNSHEGVEKVGEIGGERGELVDNDQQAGKRLEVTAAAGDHPERAQILRPDLS